MTKLYVTEFPGFGATALDGASDVDVVGEPATNTQVINTANTTGAIATLGAITPGTLYTAGTYTGVPLTGGTGSGAQATITVAGGAVTAVVLSAQGTGYTVNDSLSAAAANIGGTGSGFAIPVASITQQITLAKTTRVIELEADGICSFVVGQVNAAGIGPVATVNNARIPANVVPIRRAVPAPTGQPANPAQWLVSAITNT